jgi:hypothetical protein
LKEEFCFLFFFGQDYIIVITVLCDDDDDGDSPPAHPLPGFSFPFFFCLLSFVVVVVVIVVVVAPFSSSYQVTERISLLFLEPFTTHKIPVLLRRLTLIFACGPPPPPPPTRVIFIKRQQLSLSFDSHLYLFI